MPDDLGGLSAMFIKQLISSSMDKPSQFELLSNNEETEKKFLKIHLLSARDFHE